METEIVNIAIDNLWINAEIEACWDDIGPLDGRITMVINGRKHKFNAEIKKEVRQHQLEKIEYHFEKHDDVILIAEYIFPKIKAQLREKRIPYLEVSGNLFIRKNEVFCFIDNNKRNVKRNEKANRAFTKTGLKVVFHFLKNAELINFPQREIAEITGVALGNIPQIINGLKETGYLINLNKTEYIWEKRKELLDRWINDYATELRPKLKMERYLIPGNWHKIVLNRQVTVWGGEPAADLLTNHLRPEKFIIYTKENNVDLIKNYRFVPNKEGELEVLKMFWNNNGRGKTAPHLLIYAELMITGGKRNTETAKIIFDEYLEQII